MFSISKKIQQCIVAAGLAMGVVALGACGGGGGATGPAAQPNQVAPPAGFSGPLSSAGQSINLPSVAGFTETLTVPANNAAAGTNLSIKISQGAPAGMPALDPDMHAVIEFLYFQLSTNKDVRLNGFPGFKLTVPASFNMGNLPVKIGFYDPVSGWTHVGDFVVSSGRTITFNPTSTAVTLKAGVTYYAIPYTCGGPSPSPTPTGVISCTASGTGSVGVLCVGRKTYAFVGKGARGISGVEQIDISGGASANSTAPPTHTYSTTFNPTNCAGDEKNTKVFCGSFFSSKITDVNAAAQTNTEFDTGASGSLSFSGGSCTICAIAFDPMDTAFIVLDPNPTGGGGQYQRIGESSHAINMTILSPDPNENPGYDYVKNWVWDPGYNADHLAIADFTSGKLFTTTGAITNMGTPDSGGNDVSTHVAETPNECSFPTGLDTLADLGTASTSGSTLTVTTGQTTLTSTAQDSCLDPDASEVDSVIHLTFFVGEFGTNTLGFGLLPTTSSGTAFSDWAFVKWPLAPDGTGFFSGVDPHPIAAFNDPNNCPDCAISINSTFTWMGVVDLFKLEHAPRSGADVHSIDPTYDLVAHHVVAFYKI